VALAALETGMIEPNTTLSLRGHQSFTEGLQVRRGSWHHQSASGIVKSCDVYSTNVATKIGIDAIAEYAQMAGFGKKTASNLPSEARA